MDQQLRKVINAVMPRVNPAIAGGLAYMQISQAEEYIDSVWRAIAKTFPPSLKYEGGVRCTHEEAFEQATRRKESRRHYEVSTSYLYLMKYVFTLSVKQVDSDREVKKTIIRYLYLPFCKPGGELIISGSRYFIAPVMADKIISKSSTGIFVRLVKDRFAIEQENHDILINNPADIAGIVRVSKKFARARVYKRPKSATTTGANVNAKTSLTLYLFCKYGFTETFRRFCGVVPVYGTLQEITEDRYPPDEWVICTSTGDRIGSRRMLYKPDVALAVKRDDYMKQHKLGNMITAFFYTVDHFPERLRPPLNQYLDSTRWWRILLGHMVQDIERGDGALADAMDEHIQSLDEYVDRVMDRRFKEIGMPVNDIYEFFSIAEEHLQDWIIEGGQDARSIYGKELNSLTYLLSGITEGINKFNFKLIRRYAKKQDLTVKDIEDLLQRDVRTGLIFDAARDNAEIQSGSVSGDNMLFKVTSVVVPQSASSKGSSRSQEGKAKPEKLLHISVAEHGGYANMPKLKPDGRHRINPYSHMTPDFVLIRNPDIKDVADRTQRFITTRVPDDENRYTLNKPGKEKA